MNPLYIVHYDSTIACLHQIMHYYTCFVRAGVWKAWFLPLLQGESQPAMPKPPPTEHKQQGVVVPYTDEEMEQRKAKYNKAMETWTETVEVHTHYVCYNTLSTYIFLITRI
jgi:hypothetical protein